MKNKLSQIQSLIRGQLKQGTSKDKIAFTISSGLIFSIFPVIGSTTVIMIIVGKIFKLNHILLQTINYLMYPVQLLLIIPFINIGRICLGQNSLGISKQQFTELYQDSVWNLITSLALQQLYGVLAWLVICIPMIWGLFYLIKSKIKNSSSKSK